MKDYYEILGVARDATPNAVKIAYEGRMKKAARLSDKKRAAEERLLNEAYAILSNPAKREHFDSQRLEIDAHLEGSASKMPLVIGIVAVVVTVVRLGGNVAHRPL